MWSTKVHSHECGPRPYTSVHCSYKYTGSVLWRSMTGRPNEWAFCKLEPVQKSSMRCTTARRFHLPAHTDWLGHCRAGLRGPLRSHEPERTAQGSLSKVHSPAPGLACYSRSSARVGHVDTIKMVLLGQDNYFSSVSKALTLILEDRSGTTLVCHGPLELIIMLCNYRFQLLSSH